MLVHLEILIFSIICFELINLFKLRLHFQNLVNLLEKLIKLFLSKKISDQIIRQDYALDEISYHQTFDIHHIQHLFDV